MKIRNLKNNRTFLTILQGFLLLVILSSLFSMSVSLALYPIAGSGNLTDEIVGIAVQQEKMRLSESGSASGDPDAAAPVMPEHASAVQENVDQLPGDLADLAKNVGPFQPFAVCMYVSLSVLFMLFTVIGRKPGKLPVLRYRIGSLCFAVCAVVCLLENSENLCWLITILHGFALITDHVLSIVMNHPEAYEELCSFRGRISYDGELSVILFDLERAAILKEQYLSHYISDHPVGEILLI